MGLLKRVPVPEVADLGPVHFIAIGGSGMNGVASVLRQAGVEVSGSDRSDSDYLQALGRLGARVHIGHRAEQLGDARTVVASSAIREDNPELAEARRRGLPVLHRSVALAALLSGHRGIAVAGTHGKTTTTAMISDVLRRCGLDPSSVIGGALLDITQNTDGTGVKTGGRLGSGEFFVVEADESDGSFLQYAPEVAVVTNVDPDHLSNWGTPENYHDGFLRFATGSSLRLLVVSADDAGAVALVGRLGARAEQGPRIVTFGENPDADVVIADLELRGTGSSFTLHRRSDPTGGLGDGGPVRLSVPGRYNAWNAAAAYAVATYAQHVQEGQVDEAAIRAALSEFPGTYRRFQLVGTADGVRVFDDYAHHPTEVANTVNAARVGLDGGRLLVCFQPHLYTRTRDFAAELGAALGPADEAIVMDVCGDREDPLPGVTGALVSDAVPAGRAHVTYEPDWDAAAATVADLARPGDPVVAVGGGDVTKIAPLIVVELDRRSSASNEKSEPVEGPNQEIPR
ncbi:MAG: UDP-N-acetylmuramate--L-alanine ligase [Propionibacteriaceae bacterium]